MSTASTATAAAATPITVHVKTMAGQIITIHLHESVSLDEFCHLLHQEMDEDRPDVAFLRVLDAEGETPSVFHNGEMLFLFVEEPNLRIELTYHEDVVIEQLHDYAYEQEQEQKRDEQEGEEQEQGYGDPVDMDVYLLEVFSEENKVVSFMFYTPVYHPDLGTPFTDKQYTTTYYHEEDVTDSFPCHPAYFYGYDGPRIIKIKNGASSYSSPSHFLQSAPSRYLPFIQQKIHEVWMNHVCETGSPELYSI